MGGRAGNGRPAPPATPGSPVAVAASRRRPVDVLMDPRGPIWRLTWEQATSIFDQLKVKLGRA